MAQGGRWHSRFGIVLEDDGDILISNYYSFGGGPALTRIDAITGDERTVSSGVASSGMAVEADGDILLAATEVIRVRPQTGAQTAVTSGGAFVRPEGLALEPDGDILVVDACPYHETGSLVRVDPATGTRTTVSSGGSLVDPSGVTVERDGSIVVADPEAFGGSGGLIRVDPSTGAQTTLSSGGSFVDPRAVALEDDGDIVVADTSAYPFRPPDDYPEDGGLIRIDPATGAQSKVSSSGWFGTRSRSRSCPRRGTARPTARRSRRPPRTLLRDPRDQLETIALGGADDADGDALSWHIDSVEQDEPVSRDVGKENAPDARLAGATADANEVQVRAEREPSGDGRVYRIAYTVSDGAASCSGVAQVSVARNKHRAAVDDGETRRWDSFSGGQVVP